MNLHRLLLFHRRRYAKLLHGANELLELLLLFGFFLDDEGFDDGFGFYWWWLRHHFRFDAYGYDGSSCAAAAARTGVDERLGVGREGRFGDGLFRDGAVAFRVD